MAVENIYETTTTCKLCRSSALESILDLGEQPPANSIYEVNSPPPPKVPLRLSFCGNCMTVQITDIIEPRFLFSNYVWVTGTSKVALKYSYEFAEKALTHCGVTNPFVVEVASNDGTFLCRFQEKGCHVLGIDPAENLARAASKVGVPTKAEFFNRKSANKLIDDQGFADIVIARNIIPHVKEVHSVIEGISMLLNQNGTGIIEFHDSRMILEELQYDYIYHEHLFYFSLKSIGNLLQRHGLEIYDITRSPISGGSWVIYFSNEPRKKTNMLKQAEKQEIESGVNTLEKWLEFSRKVQSHKQSLHEVMAKTGRKVLAYGASARSSTLLNFCEINHQHISAVIDRNPLKHGMLTPGSQIPVISYEDGIKLAKIQDHVLLLAWNFQEEVIEDLRNAGYKGQFIIPLPGKPRII